MRTTALIRTILDMQLMVTPQATMLEVTSVRATVAVIVAARTPEVEAETVAARTPEAEVETVVVVVVAMAEAETVVVAMAEAEAETVVVAVGVATDACPTAKAIAIAGAFTGQIVLYSAATVKMTLPTGVADHLDEPSVVEIRTLWRLGDPHPTGRVADLAGAADSR